jgi:FAD:protein FMN transferase
VIGSVERPEAPAQAPLRITHRTRAMGGRLEIHLDAPAEAGAEAERQAHRTAERVRAWATMLTRHEPESQLMRLNADPRFGVPVGPTLAAALRWATEAGELTGGTVDVSLLDARLRAEAGVAPGPGAPRAGDSSSDDTRNAGAARPWRLVLGERHRSGRVERQPGIRLDLDGVGKGWIADRALALLPGTGALVDADGDIAARVLAGSRLEIGVGDPRQDEHLLAVLALAGGPFGSRTYGVATSGTSVHRWGADESARHHLLDPATGESALTDVVQATVIAATAREAEAWAKAVVIRGTLAGLDLVERSTALGAIILHRDGRILALPRTSRFLA